MARRIRPTDGHADLEAMIKHCVKLADSLHCSMTAVHLATSLDALTLEQAKIESFSTVQPSATSVRTSIAV